MNEVLIEINNLSFKYRKRQNFWNLKNINLKINKNEFHIFVGNNGAGKSTTINIIIGSLLNYEGDLFINGIDSFEDDFDKNKNNPYLTLMKFLFGSNVTALKNNKIVKSFNKGDSNFKNKSITPSTESSLLTFNYHQKPVFGYSIKIFKLLLRNIMITLVIICFTIYSQTHC